MAHDLSTRADPHLRQYRPRPLRREALGGRWSTGRICRCGGLTRRDDHPGVRLVPLVSCEGRRQVPIRRSGDGVVGPGDRSRAVGDRCGGSTRRGVHALGTGDDDPDSDLGRVRPRRPLVRAGWRPRPARCFAGGGGGSSSSSPPRLWPGWLWSRCRVLVVSEETWALAAMFAGLVGLTLGVAGAAGRRSGGRGGPVVAPIILFALILSSALPAEWRPMPMGDVPGGWPAIYIRWWSVAVLGVSHPADVVTRLGTAGSRESESDEACQVEPRPAPAPLPTYRPIAGILRSSGPSSLLPAVRDWMGPRDRQPLGRGVVRGRLDRRLPGQPHRRAGS